MCIVERCCLTEAPNVFKVPKKIPEEKVPVPVQKKEAPPAKGTLSLLNPTSFNNSSLSYVLCPCVLFLVCNVQGLTLGGCKYLKCVFKVPEVPKKVPEKKKIPEKKVPVPKKEAVPPAKGIFWKVL